MRVRFWPKRNWARATILILAFLIVVRALLPVAVKRYVNHVLDKSPDYDGQVGDVDIHLYRGAYSIQDIKIVKTHGQIPVPFFSTRNMDLGVSWREIFRGQVVARVRFEHPEVNFVDAEKEENKQAGTETSWSQMLDDLVPFRISRLEVVDGEVHLKKFEGKAPMDVWLHELNGQVENLTNSEDLGKDMFARVHVEAVSLGNGKLNLNARINPNTPEPTFSVQARLLGMSLPALNSMFREYGSLDFEKGTADLVAEADASNGKIEGYIKPLFRHFEVFSVKGDVERDKDSVFKVVWEAVVGTISEIFENQSKDQFATRIPIQGEMKRGTHSDLLPIIGGVLQNAFVSAFRPFYDRSVKVGKR